MSLVQLKTCVEHFLYGIGVGTTIKLFETFLMCTYSSEGTLDYIWSVKKKGELPELFFMLSKQ